MKKIEIQSLPVDEVIMHIAEKLGVEYNCRCDEYIVNIPEELGEGSIYGVKFDNGFGIISYELSLTTDLELHFVKDERHPLKFIFCYDGSMTHSFEDHQDNRTTINTFQSALIASKSTNGHILYFQKHTSIKLNSLEVNRDRFKEKYECPVEFLPGPIRKLFDDVEGKEEFLYTDHYNLAVFDVIQSLNLYKTNYFLHRIYLESKGYELLALQAALFIQDEEVNPPANEYLRKQEIALIAEAAKYLRENLETYVTIKELSREIGLNSNKLQAGFKRLYGKTINGFAQSLRLEEGSRLLLETDMNISEVLDKIGINNNSYFARIFKKKYGMNPKEYQMRGMTKRNGSASA